MQHYPQRKSPRMNGYDYSQEGAYFITVCTQNRVCLFSDIVEQKLCLSPAGEMIKKYWESIPEKFPNTFLGEFIVMPNHFHALVFMESSRGQNTLSQLIQWFKMITTNAYIKGVKQNNWIPFIGKLWQTSFHNHIIRDERGLNHIIQYILTNPEKWVDDVFYSIK